jgi:branched-subunit amino acid aminotransferase/4-amino-4-deoxychorismate lyase
MDPSSLVWIDGRVRRRDEVGVPVDDSAYAEGRGCYSTARVRDGCPLFETHHLRRLARGAAALRLGELDEAAVRHALRDLARAAFGGGEGVVRVQLSRAGPSRGRTLGEPRARVIGIPRALGDDDAEWSLLCAKLPHEGPLLAGGHKLTNRLVHALALDEARDAGVDEALLFDRQGRLVEGARSNPLVVGPDGRLRTPPLVRGCVDGIARQVLVERRVGLEEADLRRDDLVAARAVFCVNAVRGARPAASLDGSRLGREHEPWLERLSACLEVR